jgi:GTPase SAR1 family protein
LKARDNPFAADRVLQLRYRLRDGDSWDALLADLAALNYRAAIVGPEGTGKTTLLEDLAGKLTSAEQRVFSCRAPAIPNDFDDADIVCVDSAEVLSWWQWRRLRGRTRGLVVTLHRPGRLPTLRHCLTEASLLDGILAGLVPTLPATERTALADELHRTHDGNIRAALRDCYDRYSTVRA